MMELNGSHAFEKTQQQSLFQEIMTQLLKTLPSAVSLCIAAQEKASTSNETQPLMFTSEREDLVQGLMQVSFSSVVQKRK